MQLEAVFRLKHGRDAALGIPGVGLLDGVLGEHEHVGRVGGSDGRAQARDAAADDQDVGKLLGEAIGLEGNEIATLGDDFEHGFFRWSRKGYRR